MAPPHENEDEHGQRNAERAKIVLHATLLKSGHQLATGVHAFATLVKSEIHDEVVECPIHGGKSEYNVRNELHCSTDDDGIEPIAGLGPPGIQSDKGPF